MKKRFSLILIIIIAGLTQLNAQYVNIPSDIRGTQKGISIGIFNYTWDIAGIQLGILNYVKSNPKGLRMLPIFNTKF